MWIVSDCHGYPLVVNKIDGNSSVSVSLEFGKTIIGSTLQFSSQGTVVHVRFFSFERI
jgi:hypothetical protein